MQHTSQTGNIAVAAGRNPSTTSGVTQSDNRVVFTTPSVVFSVPGKGAPLTVKAPQSNEEVIEKRELSADEEDKFYKKVFKTSLL